MHLRRLSELLSVVSCALSFRQPCHCKVPLISRRFPSSCLISCCAISFSCAGREPHQAHAGQQRVYHVGLSGRVPHPPCPSFLVPTHFPCALGGGCHLLPSECYGVQWLAHGWDGDGTSLIFIQVRARRNKGTCRWTWYLLISRRISRRIGWRIHGEVVEFELVAP